MKKSALILAALMLAGCAHQGGSPRHESGYGSSSPTTMAPASDQYYSSTTWREMEIEVPEPDPNISAPTAGDYLRGLELSQDDPTLAQQLDPATDFDASASAQVRAGRDIDASASASTDIAVGGAASAESGSASSEAASDESTDSSIRVNGHDLVSSSDEAPPQSDGSVTTSDELSGSEAQLSGIPAILPPLADNHPDTSDAPNYPEGFAPESAVGGAASAETGSGSSSSAGSSSTSVEVDDDNLSNNDLETDSAPVDATFERNESDFSAPLGGGVPSDGSSGEINSGSSVDRSSPEAGAITTPLGNLSETEKSQSSSSVSSEIQSSTSSSESSSSNPKASGAPAASQSGSGSSSSVESNTNPDRDLSDQVYRQLQSNPPGTLTEDNLRDIKVSAKDGVVSLNGSVDSDAEKGVIEQGISRMQGVKSVKNNLTVGNGKADNAPEPHEK
jgi:hypothetical protein